MDGTDAVGLMLNSEQKSLTKVATPACLRGPRTAIFARRNGPLIARRRVGISKSAAEEAIGDVLETISKEVAAGSTLQRVGFGTFGRGQRAARAGRNPATGEAMEIAVTKTVKFTSGKAFEDAVNKS